jgi:sphingolipid delta-4 desaturase
MKFIQVDYPEPHLERTRNLLATHPEVKKLFGYTPSTALFVVGVVALQTALAVAMANQPWWVILVTAWCVGAFASHALWTLIHDCTHNLAFKTSAANSWLQIIANLPHVFPSAISFRIYHVKHHLYQGDPERDADLASPLEARLVGNSSLRKAIWLLLFVVGQVIRVPRLKSIQFMSRWVIANWMAELVYIGLVAHFAGWGAVGYLLAASFFSVGLHPVGARWIQEHYIVKPNQETYSYYGPLNLLAFNVGYHNEHHDLMRVPWSRLPQVRAMAPEFYDNLHYHTSWTRLLLQFLFDPKLSLYSRVTRTKVVATQKNQTARQASVDAAVAMTDLQPSVTS